VRPAGSPPCPRRSNTRGPDGAQLIQGSALMIHISHGRATRPELARHMATQRGKLPAPATTHATWHGSVTNLNGDHVMNRPTVFAGFLIVAACSSIFPIVLALDEAKGREGDTLTSRQASVYAELVARTSSDLAGCIVAIGTDQVLVDDLVLGVNAEGVLAPALLSGTTLTGAPFAFNNMYCMQEVFNDLTQLGGVYIKWSRLAEPVWADSVAIGRGDGGYLTLFGWEGTTAAGQRHSIDWNWFDPPEPCAPHLQFACRSNGLLCLSQGVDKCDNPHLDGSGHLICDCNKTGGQSSWCQIVTIVSCPPDGYCPNESCQIDPTDPTDCDCL